MFDTFTKNAHGITQRPTLNGTVKGSEEFSWVIKGLSVGQKIIVEWYRECKGANRE